APASPPRRRRPSRPLPHGQRSPLRPQPLAWCDVGMTQTQPPLDQPLHGASLPQAVSRFFRKYATFSGRASRSEYWWVYLFIILVSLVGAIGLGVLGNATQTPADRAAGQPGAGSLIFGVPLIIFWLVIIVP